MRTTERRPLDKSYEEFSFQIADLDIAGLIPPVLEADHLRMERGGPGEDFTVTLTEMKSNSKGLSLDRLKHMGRGSRLVLRNYTLKLEAKNWKQVLGNQSAESRSLFLRGCIGEVELFLNFLIANVEPILRDRIVTEVLETLRGIIEIRQKRRGGNNSGVTLIDQAVEQLTVKVEWLKGQSHLQASEARPCLCGQATFRREVQGVQSVPCASWIVTVGLLDDLFVDRLVKTLFKHSEDAFLGKPKRLVLIHTKKSKTACSKVKKQLNSDKGWSVPVELVSVDAGSTASGKLASDLGQRGGHAVVILTEFKKALYRYILDAARICYKTTDVYAMVTLAEPDFKNAKACCVDGAFSRLCRVGSAEDILGDPR